MKFVIQRVQHASVKVDGEIKGEIQKGFLVLIGVTHNDTQEIAQKMIKKMIQLRIFEDENGKTNLSLDDVDGQLLLISQFTLYADCKKGNRPSFINAGKPDMANDLYEYIIAECKKMCPVVEKGVFGADMKVELLNDGPFTVVLDCVRFRRIIRLYNNVKSHKNKFEALNYFLPGLSSQSTQIKPKIVYIEIIQLQLFVKLVFCE